MLAKSSQVVGVAPSGNSVGFLRLSRSRFGHCEYTYATVVSSNASKIAFSSAAANDGCFAHTQLSRKLASMSAIGASDWICHSFLSPT